jgi:hypothetical protein
VLVVEHHHHALVLLRRDDLALLKQGLALHADVLKLDCIHPSLLMVVPEEILRHFLAG